MTPQDFQYVCDLVREQTAIVLGPGKEYLVESRLQQLALSEGLPGLSTLLERLRSPSAALLKQAVAEAMTTNETSFFRDSAPFEVMRDKLLPDIIQQRRATRRLRIWSGACSTGQEPYSIAMLLLDSFPELSGWDIQITATDYSREVLEHARQGRYSRLDLSRGLPPSSLQRHFSAAEGGHWVISPRIQGMIRFLRCNLVGMWPISEPQDIILIRNVLIYFDDETRRKILSRVPSTLQPWGHLMLGSAESPLFMAELFSRQIHGRVVTYQRSAPT